MDTLTEKILSIISNSKTPITATGIIIALRSKAINRNIVSARLVRLVLTGKVKRCATIIDGMKVYAFKKGE